MSGLKYIILFSILCTSTVISAKRDCYAFLVGISNYSIMNTGWDDINGERDVNEIEQVLKKQRFKISKLTNEGATYDNIMNGLDTLCKMVKDGDMVYLHFSTHGQPFLDENGDEEDGWDESIIPIDACVKYKQGVYEGDNHIIDDSISVILSRLRTKLGRNGMVYMVVDACHAGSVSRGGSNQAPQRGTSEGFIRGRQDTVYIAPASSSSKSNYKLESSSSMSDILILEACKSNQVNREIQRDGNYHGPLSYFFTQTIEKYPLNETNYNIILNEVQKGMFALKRQDMVYETNK